MSNFSRRTETGGLSAGPGITESDAQKAATAALEADVSLGLLRELAEQGERDADQAEQRGKANKEEWKQEMLELCLDQIRNHLEETLRRGRVEIAERIQEDTEVQDQLRVMYQGEYSKISAYLRKRFGVLMQMARPTVEELDWDGEGEPQLDVQIKLVDFAKAWLEHAGFPGIVSSDELLGIQSKRILETIRQIGMEPEFSSVRTYLKPFHLLRERRNYALDYDKNFDATLNDAYTQLLQKYSVIVATELALYLRDHKVTDFEGFVRALELPEYQAQILMDQLEYLVDFVQGLFNEVERAKQTGEEPDLEEIARLYRNAGHDVVIPAHAFK